MIVYKPERYTKSTTQQYILRSIKITIYNMCISYANTTPTNNSFTLKLKCREYSVASGKIVVIIKKYIDSIY